LRETTIKYVNKDVSKRSIPTKHATLNSLR